ncbi:hypothetical protein V8G54_012092, partial [Vigna mungo]
PHLVGESPKTNQELQQKTKLQDQTKKPKAYTKKTRPSPKLQTFINSDQVQPNPTTCIHQKTKEGAMEEEWRREEGLAWGTWQWELRRRGTVVQWRGGEAKSSGERRGREVSRRDLGRRSETELSFEF